MSDDLGNRQKKYENITRNYLSPKQYFLLRVDGKAFHTYCKNLKRPFDEMLITDFKEAAMALAEEIQGFQFAYGQSDEVTFVFTDLQDIQTQIWFNGNIQKISSVAASIFTAEFNRRRLLYTVGYTESNKLAHFDCRVWSISQRYEVLNALLWRQQDATRNSISNVARSVASHKECVNKNSNQLQELIFQKSGQNWNNYPTHQKRGWALYKKLSVVIKKKEDLQNDDKVLGPYDDNDNWIVHLPRHVLVVDEEIPIFSQDWEWFDDKIIKVK